MSVLNWYQKCNKDKIHGKRQFKSISQMLLGAFSSDRKSPFVVLVGIIGGTKREF